MKRLLSIFIAIFVFAVATAQEEHSIIIDQSSFRAIQSDALTGVAIDAIGKDSSRRPCARLKVKINRMTRTEIDGIEVKIHSNNELIKCKTAEYDNGLILEMTALPVTRFYFYHPEFGYSNEVTLKLEADKEFYIEASLNQTYSIVVNSNVIDADVYIDGVFKGRTGSNYSLTVSEVMVGEHMLRVDYGGIKHEQKIAVNKGSIQFRQIVNTEASKPQFVVFVVQPADAILMIDGSVHPLQDGATSLMLENGTYNYTVSAQDYHDLRGTFTVAGSKVEKELILKPAYGWLSVLGGTIEGATIFVDNKAIGSAPIREYKLSSGEHQVRIIKELYKPYSENVTIRDNQTTNFTPTLTADFANVVVNAPDGAEIWINGKQKGSGSWQGKLASGVYLFEARKSGYKSSSMSQTISASSATQSYTIPPLTPIVGSLVISGTPVMADVAVDGNNVGRLPLSLDNLLIGNHTVTISKQGYVDHTESVTIAEGKTSTINVALKKYVASALKGVTPIEVDTTLSADALNKKGTDFYNNKDYNSAVQYFFAAAEKGYSTAQDWMGYCYEYGYGVTQNYAEAVKWYRKAADQGSSYSANRLAECYYYGRGVEKSYGEATRLYRLAADNGNKNAQYSLGWCYEKGYGVTINITEAKKWYQKAAAQGHEDAKKRLNELNGSSSSSSSNYSSSGKTYKVGDYYNENGLEGVVFAVSSDGRSGKIVSMREPSDERTAWAKGSERRKSIGATDKYDGEKNMAIVKRIYDWKTNYPAFAWCANLGSAWYLPAINELETLLYNASTLSKVNSTLEARGGTKLSKKGDPRWYWSSTEGTYTTSKGIHSVKLVRMNFDESGEHGKDLTDDYTFTRIRAIAKFGNGASNSYSNNNYSSSSNYSSSGRTYKVGDYYNENGMEGVVFEVSADGRSGKILNLKKSARMLNWSNDSESKRTIGANNLYDGEKNMAVVKQIYGWRDKYPLFAYCDDLGSGWYIPAKAEWETIFRNKSLIESKLTDKFTDTYWYYSSTETNTTDGGVQCAYDISMKSGGNLKTKKNYGSFGRAIAKFGSSNSSSSYSSSSQKNYSNNSSDSYSYTGNRSGRVYKVGDIYDEDGKRGVVFWTDASGRYGKIISISRSSSELAWASVHEDCYKRHGIADLHDGWKNMQKVMTIPGWREKFPPFAWCADLGEGWYLPTLEELWLLYKNRDVVKSKLKNIDSEYYYTSTEVDTDAKKVFAVNVFDNVVISYNSLKFSKNYVRAVATFGTPTNHRNPTHGPYKVGDYYNEKGKEGVVFQINSSGTSGMIVSIDQGFTMWANRDQYESETKKRIKTANEDDGLDNCGVVRQISSWKDKYPAFAWCANLGSDWYLPATNELKTLLRDSNVYNAVNNTLKQIGAPELAKTGETKHSTYWLSTESDAKPINGSYQACTIPMGYSIISDDFKYDQNLVRAVAKF